KCPVSTAQPSWPQRRPGTSTSRGTSCNKQFIISGMPPVVSPQGWGGSAGVSPAVTRASCPRPRAFPPGPRGEGTPQRERDAPATAGETPALQKWPRLLRHCNFNRCAECQVPPSNSHCDMLDVVLRI